MVMWLIIMADQTPCVPPPLFRLTPGHIEPLFVCQQTLRLDGEADVLHRLSNLRPQPPNLAKLLREAPCVPAAHGAADEPTPTRIAVFPGTEQVVQQFAETATSRGFTDHDRSLPRSSVTSSRSSTRTTISVDG